MSTDCCLGECYVGSSNASYLASWVATAKSLQILYLGISFLAKSV